MEKEDLQKDLDLLLAGRLLFGFLDCEKCIEWAISLRENGYKTDTIASIANRELKNSFEVEHQFKKLIKELGLEEKEDAQELFKTFISHVAHGVIEGWLEPAKGLSIMDGLVSLGADYVGDRIDQFSYLAYDTFSLDKRTSFYEGLTHENKDEVVKDEMKMLLHAQDYGLDRVIDLIFCKQCAKFTHIMREVSDYIPATTSTCCEKCSSEEYLAWHRIADRKVILQLIENANYIN